MKTIETMSIKCAIIFVLCLSIFLVMGINYAEEGKYPIKVEIIDKNKARYDTPENAFAAMCSSSIKEDLGWYYETLTEEAAARDKKVFQEAGIDPRRESEVFKEYFKEAYIIDRQIYKDAIVLVVSVHTKDGAVFTLPYTFKQEHNKWKMTNEYSSDDELAEYMDYTKPEEEIVISSTLRIYPKRWNFNWYNWIRKHMNERNWINHFAEKVSILCLIGNLKDNQGNPHSVKEISPETILLNNVLPAQPWRFMKEEKTALILKSKEDPYLRRWKGFKEWHLTNRFLKEYEGPVMLVKFNKFKAMETLPGMVPGEEYEVIVSGELKDGKRFKGSAKITITEWKRRHGWKWEHPGWLNSDKDIDNWWNKEKDFEGWWEKIRKEYKQKTSGKRNSR